MNIEIEDGHGLKVLFADGEHRLVRRIIDDATGETRWAYQVERKLWPDASIVAHLVEVERRVDNGAYLEAFLAICEADGERKLLDVEPLERMFRQLPLKDSKRRLGFKLDVARTLGRTPHIFPCEQAFLPRWRRKVELRSVMGNRLEVPVYDSLESVSICCLVGLLQGGDRAAVESEVGVYTLYRVKDGQVVVEAVEARPKLRLVSSDRRAA